MLRNLQLLHPSRSEIRSWSDESFATLLGGYSGSQSMLKRLATLNLRLWLMSELIFWRSCWGKQFSWCNSDVKLCNSYLWWTLFDGECQRTCRRRQDALLLQWLHIHIVIRWDFSGWDQWSGVGQWRQQQVVLKETQKNKPMIHHDAVEINRIAKLTCDELVEKRMANCCIFGTKILL